MPAPKLTPLVPGSPIVDPVDDETSDTPVAGDAARMAELEAQIAQQSAMIAQLMAQANAAPAAPKDTASRLIGIDWSSKTSAQARAEGVTQRVLCSDGYYVPG